MKSRSIQVQPLSSRARTIFKTKLNSNSTCKINSESKTHLFLKSSSGIQDYFFMIQKENDPNWSILK